jgi:hypothetical protein
MKSLALLVLLSVIAMIRQPLCAQELQVTHLPASSEFNVQCLTEPGRTYFFETSTDLVEWKFTTAIRFGNGMLVGYCFPQLGERYYIRVQHAIPVLPGLDPETEDTDGDGIDNITEILQTLGSPASLDTDLDGLTDLQEQQSGTNPKFFNPPDVTVEHASRETFITQHNLICNNQQHTKLYRILQSTQPGTAAGFAQETLAPFNVSSTGHVTTINAYAAIDAAWNAKPSPTTPPTFTTRTSNWTGWHPYNAATQIMEGILRREYLDNFLNYTAIGDNSLPAGSTSPSRFRVYGKDTDVRLKTSRMVGRDITRNFLKITRERIGSTAAWTDTEVQPVTLTIRAYQTYSQDVVSTAQYTPNNRILSRPLTLTASSTIVPPMASSWVERKHVLLDWEIAEVISDQIANNSANKLPTKFYTDEPNNPMLMATRSGATAKLRVKVNTHEPKLRVGITRMIDDWMMTSSTVQWGEAQISFGVDTASTDILYEAFVWYDSNGNGAFENTEPNQVFEKTPRTNGNGVPSAKHLGLIDKIRIVDLQKFNSSSNTAYGYGLPFSGYAGDLIETFARGRNTVPNATVATGVPVLSTQPGLSHPLGARWNIANTDTTYRFDFADGTTISNDVEDSNTLQSIVEKIIKANRAAMLAYTGPETWPVTPYYNFNSTGDFLTQEDNTLDGAKLGVALGKAIFAGQMRISYRKAGADSLEVGGIQLTGTVDDLYDWAYAGRPFTLGPVSFEPKYPAMAQAGHATLAAGSFPQAGRIFFLRVIINTLNETNNFSSRWNGYY